MVLVVLARREAKMASCLSGDLIAEGFQGYDKLVSREVTGQPHTAITSSLTWWSRRIFGCCPSSK